MADVGDRLERLLPALLDLLQGSDIRELELREGGVQIRLHRADVEAGEWESYGSAATDDVLSPEPSTLHVTSPLVGTFYRAGKPGMSPLVSQGSQVEEDTIVGIVEALQVLTEVEAGARGVVSEVLATDGQPVEYGQALFTVVTGG